MLKLYWFILFFSVPILSHAQKYDKPGNYGLEYKRLAADIQLNMPFVNKNTYVPADSMLRPGALICHTGDSLIYRWTGTAFSLLGSSSSSSWNKIIYSGGYLTAVDTNNLPTSKSNLLILTGQSNAVGLFNPDQALGLLPTPYRGPQSNVKIWWYGAYNAPVAGHFEAMYPMNNTFDSSYTNPSSIYVNMVGWGTEQSTARKIQGAFNDTLYVVKSALNGLNITNWAPPSGQMWLKLSSAITQSLSTLDALGRPVVPRAIVWMQGEADATEGMGAAYEGRLRARIADIRGIDPRLATVPFVMVKLRAGTLTQVKVDTINNAFTTLAGESPYNLTVDPTRVGSTLYDGTHYGGDMILLGNAIADTIVAHSTLPAYTAAVPAGTVTEIKVTDGNGFDMNVDGATTIPTLALGLQSGYQFMVNSTTQTFTGNKTFTGQTVINSTQAFPFRVISSFAGSTGITLGAGTGRSFAVTFQENNSDRGYFGFDPAASSLFWANSSGLGVTLLQTTGYIKIVTPTYADNAAALAGGLTAGTVYKTATGQLMVVF